MNNSKIAVPDFDYHSFVTVHLTNPSKDSTKDRLDDINFRQQVTQKISSYLIKYFVKNGSKSNQFPVQYIFEKKTNQRYHLHILMGRLNVNKCLFDKKLIKSLSKKYDLENPDYDVIDAAIKYVFRQIRLNGVPVVMNGPKAFDIRRVWDVRGVENYLSKYSQVRSLFGPQYEYEPFHSIQA